MFGYPANMGDGDSAVIRFLRTQKNDLPLLNHCGDPEECGNYAMDAKIVFEQSIIDKICMHLGLFYRTAKNRWGYITSGGSESNRWGISNGLKQYPNATVDYSTAAHYSVPKTVKMNTMCENNKKNNKFC